jgi:hypothetical protein
MVSVGKLKAGQANYYLEQAEPHPSQAAALASGAEDYYVGGREAAGRWLGRGAPSLALHGVVAGDKLTAILAGTDPTSGTQLRRRGSVEGFDVTFSAPKSVSVLFGIGEAGVQSAIRDAHERAVIDAFGYFEGVLSVARRGAGGHSRIAGNGLTAAAFLHRTSRAGDPQLHTARPGRQPHPWIRRPVVGTRRAARLRACANRGLPLPSRAPSRARPQPWGAMAAAGEGRGGGRGGAGASAAGVLASARGDPGGARAPRLVRPGRGADGGPCHAPGQGSRRERRAARARVAITCCASRSRRSPNRADHLASPISRGDRVGHRMRPPRWI